MMSEGRTISACLSIISLLLFWKIFGSSAYVSSAVAVYLLKSPAARCPCLIMYYPIQTHGGMLEQRRSLKVIRKCEACSERSTRL